MLISLLNLDRSTWHMDGHRTGQSSEGRKAVT